MLAKSCAASLSQNRSDNSIHIIIISRKKNPRASGENMNNSLVHRPSPKISICLANEQDREVIYKMRHDVYAREPGQRLENKRDDLRIGLMPSIFMLWQRLAKRSQALFLLRPRIRLATPSTNILGERIYLLTSTKTFTRRASSLFQRPTGGKCSSCGMY